LRKMRNQKFCLSLALLFALTMMFPFTTTTVFAQTTAESSGGTGGGSGGGGGGMPPLYATIASGRPAHLNGVSLYFTAGQLSSGDSCTISLPQNFQFLKSGGLKDDVMTNNEWATYGSSVSESTYGETDGNYFSVPNVYQDYQQINENGLWNAGLSIIQISPNQIKVTVTGDVDPSHDCYLNLYLGNIYVDRGYDGNIVLTISAPGDSGFTSGSFYVGRATNVLVNTQCTNAPAFNDTGIVTLNVREITSGTLQDGASLKFTLPEGFAWGTFDANGAMTLFSGVATTEQGTLNGAALANYLENSLSLNAQQDELTLNLPAGFTSTQQSSISFQIDVPIKISDRTTAQVGGVNATVSGTSIYNASILFVGQYDTHDLIATGDGSKNNPFIIRTAEDLAWLAEQVNAGNTAYNEKYYTLGNDINLTNYLSPGNPGYNGGKGWIPIGTDNPFEGHFNGANHLISGLFINDPSLGYTGLFGNITGNMAEVQNLGIEVTNITGGFNVGGVVGCVIGGSVANCYTTGPISGTDCVGGVVGNVLGGSVTNCYSTSAVNGTGNYAGGVAGIVASWLPPSDTYAPVGPSGGKLTNCYATGSVIGVNYVGGVTGCVSDTDYPTIGSFVQNCAALNPSVQGDSAVGRVVGITWNGSMLSNNVAFTGMTSGSGVPFPTPPEVYNVPDNLNGADISADAINSDGAINDLFTDPVWTTAPGKLPGFGTAVVMPPHLISTTSIVTNIVITSGNVSVQKGATQRFTAEVTGRNIPAGGVDWSVSGNNSSGTTIIRDGTYLAVIIPDGTDVCYGKLTVATDETATTLTVTATAIADRTKSATVTVTVTPATNGGGGGGGGSSNYTVTFATNGGSTVSSQRVSSNGKVTKPADPTKDGFTFSGWYSDKELTQTYDFSKAITGNTTIYAKWTQNAAVPKPMTEPAPIPTPTLTPGQSPTAWQNPFNDVKSTDWFYGDVEYAVAHGLFNGTSATTFSPSGSVTRAMFVTALWRLAGSPAASAGNQFTDVDQGAYYAEAVKWAAANSIVKGISNNQFAPNKAVTREQMAAILYRYEQFNGQTPSGAGATKTFADRSKISDYAKDPVTTLVRQGILSGKPNNLFDPQGTAMRAEVAAMLHRYMSAMQ